MVNLHSFYQVAAQQVLAEVCSDGVKFILVSDNKDFFAADSDCQSSFSGRLARISSVAEYDTVKILRQSVSFDDEFWIGELFW